MWDWSFAFSILPDILTGLKITILATVTGYIFAVVLGLIEAICMRSRFKTLKYTLLGAMQFIRSTPILVQLYMLYFVLPKFGISISAFTAGVVGLGVHYSTYLCEVYRSGIEGVDTGQWEASTALNLSKFDTWTKIIMPQAIPPIVPVLGNYFITMFKETPILSAITLVEIMQAAKIIGGHSFRYFESFTIVGIIFFLLSFPSSVFIRHLEKKINSKYNAG